jgi:transcriptional regulator
LPGFDASEKKGAIKGFGSDDTVPRAKRVIEVTAQDRRPLYQRFEDTDVRALVEAFPLAWLCGGGSDAFEAGLLPLIGVYDDEDRVIELIGHMMRSNPLHSALAQAPCATILFTGPDAYVSPEHAGLRDWAPTWNYAQVKVTADLRFDEALTEHSLEILIDAMEAGRARPWRGEELGPRYHDLLSRIIGFRATVTGLSATFKLGQNEAPETLHAILKALPDEATKAWMRRFNSGR